MLLFEQSDFYFFFLNGSYLIKYSSDYTKQNSRVLIFQNNFQTKIIRVLKPSWFCYHVVITYLKFLLKYLEYDILK